MSTSEIFTLIDAGDADGVRSLVAAEPSAAAARDEQGLSALMRAFYRGGAGPIFEAIRAAEPPLDHWDNILVGKSEGLPPPNDRSPDGFTPLHLAAFAHNRGAAEALLDAGADPNVLATASFAQVSPLGTAATFGARDVAELLLAHGADVELTADHGFTPLHSAAAGGFAELVELLLAHGARREAGSEAGKTPADLAATDEIRALLGR